MDSNFPAALDNLRPVASTSASDRILAAIDALEARIGVSNSADASSLDNRLASRKAFRAGSVTVTALELTKAITFSSAMPSTSYRVAFELSGNLAVALWPSAKSTSGFTLNLSVGIVGTIGWIACEDN